MSLRNLLGMGILEKVTVRYVPFADTFLAGYLLIFCSLPAYLMSDI